MTRLRHALVGFVLVTLWLGGVGVHLGSSDAASAATNPEAAVFHVYDLAARNHIRAFASSTAGVSQAQRVAARVSQAQPRIAGFLAAKAGAGARKTFIASDGTEIVGFTRHGINRAIGDGAKRAGVRPEALLDAIKNPTKITEGIDDLGRPFKVYRGTDARVVINPETGQIVSMNPRTGAGANR